MQENKPGPGFAGLFQDKRHEVVQVAQVSGDEDCGWMRPAAGIGIPHGKHLISEIVAPAGGQGCAKQHHGS